MRIYCPAAAVAVSLVLAGCSGGGSSAPTPTSPPETAIVDLAVGDCISDPLTVVDCSVEHDSEAYARIIVAGDDFPGAEAITAQAVAGCTEKFTSFVGLAYDDSSLDYVYYFPTAGSWEAGDRRILCLAIDPGGPVTGTLEAAAR